ncbi:YdcF family protein [Ruoffia tabacinasalis]|uniref:YdcF family protein n=1 Tax=Ruoffia tabacinasalis TaxID=87458 RepID=UPI0030D41A39
MTSQKSKFVVVTNAYHVFRALLIAKDAGLDCIGYDSRAKWYFTLNAFIQEFIGYLYFKRRMYVK